MSSLKPILSMSGHTSKFTQSDLKYIKIYTIRSNRSKNKNNVGIYFYQLSNLSFQNMFEMVDISHDSIF